MSGAEGDAEVREALNHCPQCGSGHFTEYRADPSSSWAVSAPGGVGSSARGSGVLFESGLEIVAANLFEGVLSRSADGQVIENGVVPWAADQLEFPGW